MEPHAPQGEPEHVQAYEPPAITDIDTGGGPAFTAAGLASPVDLDT